MSHAEKLRDLLEGPRIVVAPGCYDALSALLIERAGFDVAYLSGASIAYTRFGRPDLGLVGMDEVADTISLICERISIPLIADADTGFGNALNAQRTLRLFERMGASALQLEDQQLPKRCGHLEGKTLVPAAEMAGKIRAMCDAREHEQTVIIARTDAVAVEGFEPALERAERYLEAGADMLFIEALRDRAQMQRAAERFRGRVALMANMVEGGHTPAAHATELQELGFSLVIFPGAMVRVQTHAAQRYLGWLREHGDTSGLRDSMLDFRELNQLLGTQELLALGKRYEE